MQTKSTDFRIGNLVKVKGIITTITGIGSTTELGQQYYQLDGFANPVPEPLVKIIPVDEKWALKLGMVKTKRTIIDIIFGDLKNWYEIGDFSINILTNEISIKNQFEWMNPIKIKCKYIHEVQNAFFIFTGEELEFQK